ncbi:MAG: NAD(P)-binding domain-containing protein, partial [Cyclobacteriaceae bacterium]|nr:NAD(P)-binding domain-containing protein [Cyclobacteriaceae bacterium]
MKTKSLGFIGGGRITKIFLQAFQNKSVKFDSVVVFDTNNQILDSLKKQFPKIEIVNSSGLPAKQDMVMLAVHPPAMMETLNGIKDSLATESIVLSLAPKINIDKMN